MNGYKRCDGRMQAPAPRSASFSVQCSTFGVRRSPRGFTLVEVLVATTLTLIMMFAVVQIFGMISGSVSDSRALLEMSERLRAAKTLLQKDLEGITISPVPPLGENADGYLEIIEGPVGVTIAPSVVGRNTIDFPNSPDTTVRDFDDVLLFTTSTASASLAAGTGAQPQVAEVVWFVHGNRLYRRVQPTAVPEVRSGGLAHRRNRNRGPAWGALRATSFPFRVTPPDFLTPLPPPMQRDFWTPEINRLVPTPVVNPRGFASLLQSDHVVLTNVIGFDVKVFDPTAPIRDEFGNIIRDAGGNILGYGDYVDLGYDDEDWDDTTGASSLFSHRGLPASGLSAADSNSPRVYDTWSTDYRVNDADPASGTRPSPYPVPLRGIQVKIRVFEPDSRMIREVTIIQDFLPR